MPRYPHDDDWGDWMHEARKAKALDKRWAEESERATSYEQDQTCQRCGRREIVHVRTPEEAGAVLVVCTTCMTADRPTYTPDTGWTR